MADGITNVVNLATLLGGQKTTSSTTADTSAITALLQQLQQQSGQDQSVQLDAILKQALATSPQVQARLTNAVGARTGGNAPASAALERVLSDAILRGQAAVTSSQQQSQALQAQLAGALAQATKSSTTQTGTNLGRAATVLGGAQLGSNILGSELGKRAKSGIVDGISSLFSSDTVDLGGAADVSSFGADISGAAGLLDSGSALGGFDAGSIAGFGAADILGGIGGDIAGGLSDLWSSVADYGGFAEGGVVTQKTAGGRSSAAQSYQSKGVVTSDANNIIPQVASQAPVMMLPAAPQASSTPGAARGQVNQTPGALIMQAQSPEKIQGQNMDVGQAVLGALLSMIDPTMALAARIGGVTDGAIPTIIKGGAQASNQAAATMDVNSAQDPLGALAIAGKLVTASDAMSMGSDSLAAAANATSAVTGADPLDSLMKLTNSFGTAPAKSSSGGSFDSRNLGNYSSGYTGGYSMSASDAAGTGFSTGGIGSYGGGSSGGDSGGDSGSDGGMAQGGKIRGPGSGTSDSVDIKAAHGEYINSADVVEALGVSFFENLQKQFGHTPKK